MALLQLKTGDLNMFDEINKRSFYRKRHLDAPLLNERLKYLEHLKGLGKSPTVLKDTAGYLLRIVQFLRLKIKRTISYDEIETAADSWARYQCNHPQKKQSYSKKSNDLFIRHAIDWFKLIGCLEVPPESLVLFYEIFERKHAIDRHSNAPLLEERMQYLKYWANNGAKTATLRNIAQYLLRVAEYVNVKNKKAITKKEIVQAANKWACYQSTNPQKRSDFSMFAKKRFIGHAVSWLGMIGRLSHPAKDPQPFEKQLFEYIDYMRLDRGFSEETIRARNFQLKNFLKFIAEKIKSFDELNISILDAVIVHKKNVDCYSRRSIQNYTSVMRSFIRYAEQKNWCRKDLAKSIKLARTYRHESLPYSPSWDDVKKLLEGTEGNNPTDIRDRAILMLLAVYGLRRIEVAKLTLDDLDWKKGLIYLNRAKECKPQQFPLSTSVGETILRYIKEARPNNCQYRNVFISKRAPLRALSANAIYEIVNRRWKSLDVKIKHYGPHSLRHACATHLINEGVSLKEISDHLGHGDMEATRIYAKVDLVNLRKVSEFDIGDLL